MVLPQVEAVQIDAVHASPLASGQLREEGCLDDAQSRYFQVTHQEAVKPTPAAGAPFSLLMQLGRMVNHILQSDPFVAIQITTCPQVSRPINPLYKE